MDEKTRELISVGAAYAANCHACLAYHIRQAAQVGLSEDELKEAIGVAQKIREASARRADSIVGRLVGPPGRSGRGE